MSVVRKHKATGTLKGAYAPSLEGVELPASTLKPSKEYLVKAPSSAKPGQPVPIKIKGEKVTVTVPEGFDRVKAARFPYTQVGDVDKIIASTLPAVPGYEIAWSKPIVFAVETLIVDDKGFSGKATVASTIADLSQEVQNQVNSLAIDKECNAVLGCQFSVSTDRDAKAATCRVAVTCFGTPCVLVPSGAMPLVAAQDDTKEMLYDDGKIADDDRSLVSAVSFDNTTTPATTAPSLLGPSPEEKEEED